jgi:hypothetical protein
MTGQLIYLAVFTSSVLLFSAVVYFFFARKEMSRSEESEHEHTDDSSDAVIVEAILLSKTQIISNLEISRAEIATSLRRIAASSLHQPASRFNRVDAGFDDAPGLNELLARWPEIRTRAQ